MIESVWLQLGPFQRQVLVRLNQVPGVDHHKQIINALRARDVEALGEAVKNDIREGISRSGLSRSWNRSPEDSLPPDTTALTIAARNNA